MQLRTTSPSPLRQGLAPRTVGSNLLSSPPRGIFRGCQLTSCYTAFRLLGWIDYLKGRTAQLPCAPQTLYTCPRVTQPCTAEDVTMSREDSARATCLDEGGMQQRLGGYWREKRSLFLLKPPSLQPRVEAKTNKAQPCPCSLPSPR